MASYWVKEEITYVSLQYKRVIAIVRWKMSYSSFDVWGEMITYTCLSRIATLGAVTGLKQKQRFSKKAIWH